MATYSTKRIEVTVRPSTRPDPSARKSAAKNATYLTRGAQLSWLPNVDTSALTVMNGTHTVVAQTTMQGVPDVKCQGHREECLQGREVLDVRHRRHDGLLCTTSRIFVGLLLASFASGVRSHGKKGPEVCHPLKEVSSIGRVRRRLLAHQTRLLTVRACRSDSCPCAACTTAEIVKAKLVKMNVHNAPGASDQERSTRITDRMPSV